MDVFTASLVEKSFPKKNGSENPMFLLQILQDKRGTSIYKSRDGSSPAPPLGKPCCGSKWLHPKGSNPSQNRNTRMLLVPHGIHFPSAAETNILSSSIHRIIPTTFTTLQFSRHHPFRPTLAKFFFSFPYDIDPRRRWTFKTWRSAVLHPP